MNKMALQIIGPGLYTIVNIEVPVRDMKVMELLAAALFFYHPCSKK